MDGSAVGNKSMTPGKVAIASMVGTIMEWYDFFLYGFVAALVFGHLFFPGYSTVAGTLASFATLAVGFVARPLGGVIFGHFGDRIGRKGMLLTTLSLMGGATFCIGLLPTYQNIGVWAPVFLTVCRFFQGIALGGEWGGAMLMAVEYAPPHKKGFFGGIVQIGATTGLALGVAILFAASYLLRKDDFMAWGWRVPFLVSFVMLFAGLYIRLKITESPAFRKVLERGAIVKFPIVDVVKNHPKVVICVMAVYLGAVTVPFYTVWVFLTYYAASILHMNRSGILLGIFAINVALCFAILGAGYLYDRIGRSLFHAGFFAMAAIAFPFFWLANLADMKYLWLAMVLMATPSWVMFGALPGYYTELFPEQLRYTGISLGAQASTIVGGLVPIFATAVLSKYGTWPISALVMICALLGGVAVLSLQKSATRTVSLAGDSVRLH